MIWLGGPEVSYDAKVLEEHPVTGVMKGEGEVTFWNWLILSEGISELAKIDGITYRDGDQIQKNPGRNPRI